MKTLLLSAFLLLICVVPAKISGDQRPRKIVLIAGEKSHGPGEHEYLKSVRLLNVLLDRSTNLQWLKTELYFNAWPDNPSVLATAETMIIFPYQMQFLPPTH